MGKTFDLPASSTGKINLVVAPTGSVASIKIPILLERLLETGRFNLVLLPSYTAQRFYPATAIPAGVTVLSDRQEWSDQADGEAWLPGDEILHIELRRWCDILLICPLSAHTLAAIHGGLCDTLLLELVRAWDYAAGKSKRLVCCPAMNTAMYEHPLTARHLDTLVDLLGFEVVGPVSKTLACGDTGMGAMSSVEDIVRHLLS